MKKRYFVAGFLALGAIGGLITGPSQEAISQNKANIDQCIEWQGRAKQCDRIRTSEDDGRYVPGEYAAKAKQAVELRKQGLVASKAEAKQAKIDRIVNNGLIKRCEGDLKLTLKDPDSYKRVSAHVLPWGNEKSVTISYSATNSYGGRVRNQEICRYVSNA